MENWLQEREGRAEHLRLQAQQSGNKSSALLWERFARQTARMKATDQELRRALPKEYAVASGLWLVYQGKEHYLEHLVIGPTGIFLVESMEGEDPSWQQDLTRNIAFFQEALGAEARFFICLVVTRSHAVSGLPAGAHLMTSLENAVSVITDRRMGETLSPSLAQEVWHLVEALRPSVPKDALQKEPSLFRLEHLPHLVAMLIALVLAVVVGGGISSFASGLVIFLLPTAFVMSWARKTPHRVKRTVLAVILVQLIFLIRLLQSR